MINTNFNYTFISYGRCYNYNDQKKKSSETNLKWYLNSPPKPHAFASLPLKSNMYFLIPIVISILVTVSVKFPFVKLLYILDFAVFIPVVILVAFYRLRGSVAIEFK